VANWKGKMYRWTLISIIQKGAFDTTSVNVQKNKQQSSAENNGDFKHTS
jgi:hypothetical protein